MIDQLRDSLKEHEQLKQRIADLEHVQGKQIVMLRDANKRYRDEIKELQDRISELEG